MVLGCALSAFAQAPITSGIERMVAHDATALLVSSDAETRGEAAIVVAASGAVGYEATLLEIAKDADPAARHRGMLALGLLATPAAVSFLESQLRSVEDRISEDGVTAAFALGCTAIDRVDTSIARTLPLFGRGSWKRQHDVLVALLLAMTRGPERAERSALRILFDNEANRSPTVRALLLQLLLPIDRTIADKDLRRTMRRGSSDERLAIVKWLASRPPADNKPWIEELTTLAKRADDPELRAAALLALTRYQHLPALEIAARALKSSNPKECSQALASMLSIGGAKTRGALEQHLLVERNPVRMAAMMSSFLAPPSKELIDHAVSVATNAKLPITTRTAAAQLISRSDKKRARPMLRDLFRIANDPQLLLSLARALRRAEDTPTALARLLDQPVELPQHPGRWQALLSAGHGEAQRQVLATLKDPKASTNSVRTAIKVWRKAMVIGTLGAEAPSILLSSLE